MKRRKQKCCTSCGTEKRIGTLFTSYRGKTDVPLSGRAGKWWRRPGRLYRDTHFDVCFCSPLIRARETAEIILRGRNIPIIEDVRLEEMGFGVCEGTTDFTENPDNPIHLLFRAPETYVTPAEGGESLAELFERTGAFLREAAEPLLRQGKDVLIVGHGAMNASIICQIRQIPLKDFWGVKMKTQSCCDCAERLHCPECAEA